MYVCMLFREPPPPQIITMPRHRYCHIFSALRVTLHDVVILPVRRLWLSRKTAEIACLGGT